MTCLLLAVTVLVLLAPVAIAESGSGSDGVREAPAKSDGDDSSGSDHDEAEIETHGPGSEGREITRHGREGREPEGGPGGHPLDTRTRSVATATTVSASLPQRWCGTPRTTEDRAHDRPGSAWRFHGVYAVPSDGADRFTDFATTLQTDAFQASGLLEQLYGRAIRFDMGTDCGPQFLDLTVLRLAETTAQLEQLSAQPNGTIDAIGRALQAHGMPVTKTGDSLDALRRYTSNYVVWLDGPGPEDACGQATMEADTDRNPDTNRNNFGGKIAAVFRDGDGFCNSTAVRHEVAHTLGALQAPAPHAEGGPHCADAFEDTMCVDSAPQIGPSLAEGAFDFGNDDYWSPPGGPPLAWWTVDQSRFLCTDVACNVPAPRAQRQRLRTTMTRRSARWNLALRATGAGRGEITVSCRPQRRAATRVVHRRTVRPPAALRIAVRCFSRPKVLLTAR